jgi:hypothetical protein
MTGSEYEEDIRFGHWNLGLIWNLVLGAWIFLATS